MGRHGAGVAASPSILILISSRRTACLATRSRQPPYNRTETRRRATSRPTSLTCGAQSVATYPVPPVSRTMPARGGLHVRVTKTLSPHHRPVAYTSPHIVPCLRRPKSSALCSKKKSSAHSKITIPPPLQLPNMKPPQDNLHDRTSRSLTVTLARHYRLKYIQLSLHATSKKKKNPEYIPKFYIAYHRQLQFSTWWVDAIHDTSQPNVEPGPRMPFCQRFSIYF